MRPQIVKKIKILAPTVLFFLTSAISLGQARSASSSPPAPEMGRTPPELPIDSGLMILLIAGLVYGIYIVRYKMRAKDSLS
jgi:hypothetical protein